MIYAGTIQFGANLSNATNNRICISLQNYFNRKPNIIKKGCLTLFCTKVSELQDLDKIYENNSSVLIGRIFDKDTKKQAISFHDLSKEKILDKIWGRYIYFCVSKNRCQYEIITDISSQLPFYYYTYEDGSIIFASSIDVFFKITSHTPEKNWTYIWSYLTHGNTSTTQTAFKNLKELPPGCNAIVKKEAKTEIKPFWNPTSLYNSHYIKYDAVSVLNTSLKSWIAPYKNVCISLSGGLDSSAIAYCVNDIKTGNQNLSALNFFHSAIQSSNEVHYARKVSQETGIKLIEIDISNYLPFSPFDKNYLLKPNKPFPGLSNLGWLDMVQANIPFEESCIFISGHGSDQIFMRPPSKRSILDYIIINGLTGSSKYLKNVMGFYTESFFSIFQENIVPFISYYLKNSSYKTYNNTYPDWINPSLRSKAFDGYMHPIHSSYLSKKILPGKYNQIEALLQAIATTPQDINQDRHTYYPFLNIPMIEFALNLPSYELFNASYDRYPLRQAVCSKFKTDTVWRRSKSQTTGVSQLGIKKNLEYILSICLEGELVREGFIDKDKLYKTIILVSNGDTKDMWSLTHIFSCELFFNIWTK